MVVANPWTIGAAAGAASFFGGKKGSRYEPYPMQRMGQKLSEGGKPSSILPTFFGSIPGETHQRAVREWFSDMSPALALSLFNSPSYGFLQDRGNWDDSMGAYGAGAGILGEQAARGESQGQQQLSRMGLGRSGARAALSGQTAQALGSQQANLFSNLYQQSIANRLTGAQRAFDLDRAIMGMALGMPMSQRTEDDGSGIKAMAANALGQGAGQLLGSLPFMMA